MGVGSVPGRAVSSSPDRAPAPPDPVAGRATELEHRLHEIEELAGVGYWHLDLRTDEVTWTPALFRLFDLPVPPGDARGLRDRPAPPVPEHAKLFDAADWARLEYLLQRATTQGLGYDVVLCGSGSPPRHYQANCKVRTDDEGTPIALHGTCREVTELVQLREEIDTTEARLARNEALLLQFMKHAPAAIAMVDRLGRLVGASDEFVAGYIEEGTNILGRDLFASAPLLPRRWQATFDRVLDGQAIHEDGEKLKPGSGAPVWVRWQARPWYGFAGDVGGILLFIEDITAERRLRAALMERERQLQLQSTEAAERAENLAAYAHAASHELQRPLNEMVLSTQLLQEARKDDLDEAMAGGLQAIVHAGRHASKVIRDLVAFTELSDKPPPTRARTRVDKAVESAISDEVRLIRSKGARLDLGHGLPSATVQISRVELTSVVSKVLHNALVHGHQAEPVIRIEVTESGTEVLIRVSDNGQGIPTEHRETIFHPFRRLAPSGTGTGLGLAWCRRVLTYYGARIWFEEPEGRGAVACIALKRAQSTEGS